MPSQLDSMFAFYAPKSVKIDNCYLGLANYVMIAIATFVGLFYSIVYGCQHLARAPVSIDAILAVIEVSDTMMGHGVDPVALWGHASDMGKRILIPRMSGVVIEELKDGMWLPKGMAPLEGVGRQEFLKERNFEPKDYPFKTFSDHSLKDMTFTKFGGDVFKTKVEVDAFSADLKRMKNISGLLWETVPGRYYDTTTGSYIEQEESPGAWTLGTLLCMAENGTPEHCENPASFGDNIITVDIVFSNRQKWDYLGRAPITFSMKTRENKNLNVEPRMSLRLLSEGVRRLHVEFGPQVILEVSSDVTEFSVARLLSVMAGYSFLFTGVQALLVFLAKNLLPRSEKFNALLVEEGEVS